MKNLTAVEFIFEIEIFPEKDAVLFKLRWL